MVYYTTIDNKEYGWLLFKVIGVNSKKEAQEITRKNWQKSLMEGQTLDGPPTICPLFSHLRKNVPPGQIS